MFWYQAPERLVLFLEEKNQKKEIPDSALISAIKVIAFGENPRAVEIVFAFYYEVSDDFIKWISSLIEDIEDEDLHRDMQILIKKASRAKKCLVE